MFNSAVKYREENPSPDRTEYFFLVDKLAFICGIFKSEKISNAWEIGFDLNDAIEGEEEFSDVKLALYVFSTIKEIIYNWIRKHNPERIVFEAKDAETSKSRVELYRGFAAKLGEAFNYKQRIDVPVFILEK